MYRKYSLFFIFIIYCTIAREASSLTPKELLDQLKKASEHEGVQVGIIVDPQNSDSEVFAKLVTLRKKPYSAYEALEKSGITIVYSADSNFKIDPPWARVESLDAYIEDKKNDQDRNWSLLIAVVSGNDVKWEIPRKKGTDELAAIGDLILSDGALIGFSRTAWHDTGKKQYMGRKDKNGNKILDPVWEPNNKPRIK